MKLLNRYKQSIAEGCLKCGRLTYNKETHECCGRSYKKWLSLLAFYLLYVCFTVSGFFGILFVMMHIMEHQGQEGLRSKLTLFTGATPGIAILPKLPRSKAPLMWYASRPDEGISPDVYIEQLDKFLANYNFQNSTVYVDCSKTQRKTGQYCRFSKNSLGPCANSKYGYDTYQPCLFLKLNKVIGWDPNNYRPEFNAEEEDRVENQIIMVNCKAINHFDAEHLGPIHYYPNNGFYEYYFPYDGSDLYVAPIVAVQFPEMKKGHVIGIKCLSSNVGINREDEAYYTDTIYLFIKN